MKNNEIIVLRKEESGKGIEKEEEREGGVMIEK